MNFDNSDINLIIENFISTKVTAENLTFDRFIGSTLKSLKNLHVKKIDLIQPHWPNYDVKNDEIIKAFKHLKRDKKVRFFGLSNYDLKDIKYFKKKLKDSFKSDSEATSWQSVFYDNEVSLNIEQYYIASQPSIEQQYGQNKKVRTADDLKWRGRQIEV